MTPTTAAVMPVSGAVNFAVGRLDQGGAAEDEQERWQEGEKGGHTGPRDTREQRVVGAEDFLGRGADEPHEGHHHDERAGRGLAERQAVDHLTAGEPAVVLDRALVDIGQHRVGAAEREERCLGKERAHIAQGTGRHEEHSRAPQGQELPDQGREAHRSELGVREAGRSSSMRAGP